MNENYDMNSLYLYYNDWGNYEIGKIEKINDKSIRMEHDTKIKKEEFDKVYKLTNEEIKIFRKELIKNLSTCVDEIKRMLYSVRELQSALDTSEFACIDSDKLQEQLNLLNEKLSEELPKTFKINNEEFKFEDYGEDIEKVE